MGNSQSNEEISLSDAIDYLATNYILTNNFQDLKNLSDMKYCNNLVVLTSDILQRNMNMSEITYLDQRIKNGLQINKMSSDNVIYLSKDSISENDVKNQTKKKRLCYGVAKFYVKVAHLYAAIVSTINPVYTYYDNSGILQEVSLMNKNDIPMYANITLKHSSICSNRITSLMKNQNSEFDKVEIEPSFCNNNRSKKSGKTRTLLSEPGIPELLKLYYDKYDYNKGKFTGMTKKMKKIYEKDVKMFYKAYTGEDDIPDNIKRFGQIPLHSFHKIDKCKKNGLYNKTYVGTTKDKLLYEYANHLKNMMRNAETNQNELLSILDELFLYDETSGLRKIKINPELTDKKLHELITKSRSPIIDLYLTCEQDFLKGLEIFEAIVESQMLETTKQQITSLERDALLLSQDQITTEGDEQTVHEHQWYN